MAATVTCNRTVIDQADATTYWTGSITMTLLSSDPVPIESGYCIGQRNNNTTTDCYATPTFGAKNFLAGQTPGPSLIYVWIYPRTIPDTRTAGGIAIQLGDGTNRVAFHVGGSDVGGFRHELGPTLWQCFVLDTTKAALAAAGGAQYTKTVKSGSAASLNFGAITQYGYQLVSNVTAAGTAPNTYIDIMRFAPVGVGLTITGTGGVMTDITAQDKLVSDLKALGVIRDLGTGTYGLQGVLMIGDASGTASTTFSIANETIVFPGFMVDTDKYQIILQQGGTGSTTVTISGSTIYCPSGIGAKFDAGGAGTINLDVDGSFFFGFSQGVVLKANHTFNDSTISNSGAVTAPGTDLRGTSVLVPTVAADASALVWNVATDTDGLLDNMTFSKGAAAHHAINLGASSPDEVTLDGITFASFNAADAANDSVLYLSDKGTDTAWVINTVGCTGTVSYKKARAGDTVSIVANPVTLLVHVQDAITTDDIVGAGVMVKCAAGGPKPYQASVSIVQSGGAATVTHNSHGLATDDYVIIEGCNEGEYNGGWKITVTGSNTYDYTLVGSPASPATGTPVSTFAPIYGTTDGDGDISDTRAYASDQPFTGRVRKATSAPLYKTQPISGTISSAAGASLAVNMISDD